MFRGCLWWLSRIVPDLWWLSCSWFCLSLHSSLIHRCFWKSNIRKSYRLTFSLAYLINGPRYLLGLPLPVKHWGQCFILVRGGESSIRFWPCSFHHVMYSRNSVFPPKIKKNFEKFEKFQKFWRKVNEKVMKKHKKMRKGEKVVQK